MVRIRDRLQHVTHTGVRAVKRRARLTQPPQGLGVLTEDVLNFLVVHGAYLQDPTIVAAGERAGEGQVSLCKAMTTPHNCLG